MGDVEIALLEHGDQPGADLGGGGKGQTRAADILDMADDELAHVTAQLVATLAADAEELDLLALVAQLAHLAPGGPHDGGVEAAAQAPVRGHDHDEMRLVAAVAGE